MVGDNPLPVWGEHGLGPVKQAQRPGGVPRGGKPPAGSETIDPRQEWMRVVVALQLRAFPLQPTQVGGGAGVVAAQVGLETGERSLEIPSRRIRRGAQRFPRSSQCRAVAAGVRQDPIQPGEIGRVLRGFGRARGAPA